MRVALIPVGTRGDVEPMLVLARALAARGHAVVFGAPEDHRGRVEAAGFGFGAVGVEVQARLRELELARVSRLRALAEVRRIVLASAPTQVEEALAVCEGADLVVSAGTGFGACHAAEKLRVPCVAAFYAPGWLPSSRHAPVLMPVADLPGFVNRLLWRTTQRQGDRMMRGPVNASRARLGLAPLRSLVAATPSRMLLAWDPVLGAPPDDSQLAVPGWPAATYAHTGALVDDDATAPLPVDVEAFVSAGPRPCFVGFGSMVVADPAALGALLDAVATELDLRIVWGLGGSASVPARTERVLPIAEAPYRALFARCRLIVHHGGAGTTATALRAGVPQWIVPHLADQFFFGARVHALGLGPAPLPRRRLGPRRLAAGLRAFVAREDALAARADALRAELPAEPVATAVEALARWGHAADAISGTTGSR